MVIRFSNMMKKTEYTRPILNEIPTNYSYSQTGAYANASSLNKKRQLWDWFKTRPELNSPVWARVNDTITQVEFFDPNGKPLGRNKRLEAEKFYSENFMDDRMKSIWFDSIITGDGFGWKGNASTDQLKEVSDMFAQKMGISLKMDNDSRNEMSNRLLFKAMDEDKKRPRVFDYIPSSTVEIMHDEIDVVGYKQWVGTNQATFDTDSVIHFKFSDLNGKVEGFTPVESLAAELMLIWFIKENMLAYAKNGGLPRKIFSLKNEIANSKNHNYLVEKLEEYGVVENRHGNLVFTGEVDVHDLDEKIRDMEYKDLALYVTGNIAYALQIPVSRIPYMIGQAQSSGDAGGLAEEGYWSMIESDQRKIAYLLNTQCFNALGFSMRFKKKYKVNDLREVQGLVMKADAIQKTQAIFRNYKMELTDQKIKSLLDLNEDDVRELKNPELVLQQESMGQGTLPGTIVNNNDAKNKKNETKRNAVENDPKSSQPGGVL